MDPDKEAVLAAVRARDYRRTTFAARQRPALRALTVSLMGEEPIAAAPMEAFLDDYDHFVSRASKTLRFGMVVLLDVLRFVLPLVVLRRFSTFEELSLGDRSRMLEKMESHRIVLVSLIFVAFKTPMMIVWFEDEARLRELGYPGEARERYKRLLPVAA